MAAFSQFPALERVAQAVGQLNDHRQRQTLAFIAARYGLNLKPTAKKIAASPSQTNRGEFAAIEIATDELDQLRDEQQQRQAVTMLAVSYGMEVTTDYKPPTRGYSPRRKLSKA